MRVLFLCLSAWLGAATACTVKTSCPPLIFTTDAVIPETEPGIGFKNDTFTSCKYKEGLIGLYAVLATYEGISLPDVHFITAPQEGFISCNATAKLWYPLSEPDPYYFSHVWCMSVDADPTQENAPIKDVLTEYIREIIAKL